mgnify:CR=1 FL=1
MKVTCCSDLHNGPAGHPATDATPGWREAWEAVPQPKERLGDMKYFIKKQLKWVPGMGWGLQFLDCLFVERDWASDREQIRRTFDRLVRDDVPIHLVSFAEGTRLTQAKLEAAKSAGR